MSTPRGMLDSAIKHAKLTKADHVSLLLQDAIWLQEIAEMPDVWRKRWERLRALAREELSMETPTEKEIALCDAIEEEDSQ